MSPDGRLYSQYSAGHKFQLDLKMSLMSCTHHGLSVCPEMPSGAQALAE